MTWASVLILLLVIGVAAAPFVLEAQKPPVTASDRTQSDMQFVRLSQGVTAYKWYGGVRGPVIVAVHGLTTPSPVWDDIARRLAGLGFRVLVYDLYGRGLSDAPPGPQDAAFLVRQLDDLLADQQIAEDFTLMGYSMGGAIATAFAVRQGNRLQRLILLAGAGIIVRESGFSKFCRLIPWVGDWVYLTVAGRRMAKELAVADGGMSDDLLSRTRIQTGRRGYLPAVLSSRRHMLARQQRDAHRKIGADGLPVIAIWGGQDRVIPLTALGQLAQWNRLARQDVVDLADHALPYSHADEVVDRLIVELRDLVAEPVETRQMREFSEKVAAGSSRDGPGET